jgi:hypothetical protein
MDKIKQDIKNYFDLDYDFDLRYKGAKISETSSLYDNGFDDSTPLVVSRIDNKDTPDKYKRPARSQSQPRQNPLVTNIHRVSSLTKLWEQEIEDETESGVNNTTVSNEEYHWKPTINIFISSVRPIEDEETDVTIQTSNNNLLTPRFKLPSLNESTDQTTNQNSHPAPTLPFSTEVQPAHPFALSINTNSPRTGRSPTRNQRTINLLLESHSPVTARNTPLVRKNILEKTDSIENLHNTGKDGLLIIL